MLHSTGYATTVWPEIMTSLKQFWLRNYANECGLFDVASGLRFRLGVKRGKTRQMHFAFPALNSHFVKFACSNENKMKMECKLQLRKSRGGGRGEGQLEIRGLPQCNSI